MKYLHNLRIAQRIWFAVALLGLALVGILASAALRAVSVKNEQALAAPAQAAKMQLSNQWIALTQLNAERTVATLAASDNSVGDFMKAQVAKTSEEISSYQKQIDALATAPEEKAHLAKVSEARKAYVDARKAALALKADGKGEEASQALRGKVQPALEQYLTAQREFGALQVRMSEDLRDGFDAQRMRSTMIAGAQLVVLMLLVCAGAHWLVKSIRQPMAEACEAAEQIGAGNLAHEIDASRGDEIGDMLRAVSHMKESLLRIIAQVKDSTDSIGTASNEVASGNADLSARTEQAASNLQQTASSMEQLTGTVKQTADSAHTANQLASSASTVARRGGEVVTQVVSTMDEINASSKKIADIISVIDGIAFQTNILALNAAVEAARAGEQGRGFAVVAGEVRSLAQRSAEAAKEIKALIGTSVDKVEVGSRLVKDAGSTMDEIVASVQRVSDIIGEITAAASEQSSGIGQVNVAVTQLDQMTQQNAALVEQSAAAAESLKEQAHRLTGVVGTFRLAAG